jgi:hypothetical protein
MTDDIPLRDYVEHIYKELQAEMDRRFAEQMNAAGKVASDLSVRLGIMNEFRGTVNDVIQTKVSRDMYDSFVVSSDGRIRRVEDRVAEIESANKTDAKTREEERASVQQRVVVLGLILAALTIVINVAIQLVEHIH